MRKFWKRVRVVCGKGVLRLQAHNTESNDPIGIEEIGDSKRKAEEYADHAGPIQMLAFEPCLSELSPRAISNEIPFCNVMRCCRTTRYALAVTHTHVQASRTLSINSEIAGHV